MLSQRAEFKFLDRNFKDILVLIPGWATDYRIFMNLELNYNYLLPVRLNPATFFKELLALLNKMSLEKISILGWSLGGFLATDFARKHADRIDTLILLGIRKSFNAAVIRETIRALKRNRRACLYKFYLNCFSENDQEGLSWFKEHLLMDYIDEMSLEVLMSGLGYLASVRIEPEYLVKVKRIRIFYGSDDKIAPLREISALKSKLGQAEFICLPGLGHLFFLNRQFKERFYHG